jgi:hypothetical protein
MKTHVVFILSMPMKQTPCHSQLFCPALLIKGVQQQISGFACIDSLKITQEPTNALLSSCRSMASNRAELDVLGQYELKTTCKITAVFLYLRFTLYKASGVKRLSCSILLS